MNAQAHCPYRGSPDRHPGHLIVFKVRERRRFLLPVIIDQRVPRHPPEPHSEPSFLIIKTFNPFNELYEISCERSSAISRELVRRENEAVELRREFVVKRPRRGTNRPSSFWLPNGQADPFVGL